MESISTATTTLLTISKALNPLLSSSSSLLSRRRFTSFCPLFLLSNSSSSPPPPLSPLFYSVLPLLRRRLQCVSNSASFSASPAGGNGAGGPFGGGGDGGGNGGGDGRANGGDSKSNLASGEIQDLSGLSPDVIILDVGGMSCGGCAASVKRILESQPKVSSATVNLTTETAIVWPASEAKVVPNWQSQLGEALAKHLTTCGFSSNLRVAGQGAIEGDN